MLQLPILAKRVEDLLRARGKGGSGERGHGAKVYRAPDANCAAVDESPCVPDHCRGCGSRIAQPHSKLVQESPATTHGEVRGKLTEGVLSADSASRVGCSDA
jgi:hypothetical protein